MIWILLQALYLFYFRDNSRLESIIVLGGKLMRCREPLAIWAEGEREGCKLERRWKTGDQASAALTPLSSQPRVGTLFCQGSGSVPLLVLVKGQRGSGNSASMNQILCPPDPGPSAAALTWPSSLPVCGSRSCRSPSSNGLQSYPHEGRMEPAFNNSPLTVTQATKKYGFIFLRFFNLFI